MFIWLLFAHYIGDVALQNQCMAEKEKYWYLMLVHCMVWTACISIALEYLGLFILWKALFLFTGHFICDKWKSSIPRTPENWKYVYPDQMFHIFQCLFVYLR